MNALVVTRSAECSESDIGDVSALLRRCRVPLTYRSSLSQAQILAFRATEKCLDYPDRPTGEHTGVLVGITGNTAVQRRNAMRIACGASTFWGEMGVDPNEALDATARIFGGGSQDKIGEMASSIPARLAVAFRLRGRVLALDAHETTVPVALSHALLLLGDGVVDSLLLVFVDEHEGISDARASVVEVGRDSGLPREGRAVAILVRQARTEDIFSRILEVRFRRRPRGALLQRALEQEACGTDVRIRGSGSARVTDAALAILKALDECDGKDVEREISTVSGSGAVAVVRVVGGTRCVNTSGERGKHGVVVIGTSAWFADARGREAFDRISQPFFRELKDRIPRQLCSEGSVSSGRTYCMRGAVSSLMDNPPSESAISAGRLRLLEPVRLAALHVCSEAIDTSGCDLTGRNGMVVVATPLGIPCGRLSDLGTEETRRILERLCSELGMDAATSSRLQEHLVAESSEVRASAMHSIDTRSSCSVAAFVADELGLDALPLAVEAACASSLAALDVAFRSLRLSRTDYVLVCGVEFPTGIRDLVLCSALGMLSRSTAMTPFSEAADGFLPGDGAGAVLLLPDYETENGVRVLGVGGSCDARSMLAPDANGQRVAMEMALAEAGVEAVSIGYVEAHGTGTVRGDAVELESMTAAYGINGLCIGSVKSSIGHTFSAAGLAGFLRVEAAVREGTVPRTPGLTEKDRRRLQGRGFHVPSGTEFLPVSGEGIGRAAVSAFGTGGINYHVIVEEGGKK